MRVLLYLLSQTGYSDMQEVDLPQSVLTPYFMEDRAMCHSGAGMLNEETNEIEFGRRKLDRFATNPYLPSDKLNCEVACTKKCIGLGRIAASHKGIHAGDKLTHREWLDDVIISSGFEKFDDIMFGLTC